MVVVGPNRWLVERQAKATAKSKTFHSWVIQVQVLSSVFVVKLLWQTKRCSRIARDSFCLTGPPLLSRDTRGFVFGAHIVLDIEADRKMVRHPPGRIFR
jgi:hypothetical protein